MTSPLVSFPALKSIITLSHYSVHIIPTFRRICFYDFRFIELIMQFV